MLNMVIANIRNVNSVYRLLKGVKTLEDNVKISESNLYEPSPNTVHLKN